MYYEVRLHMGYAESKSLACIVLQHNTGFETPQELMENLFDTLKRMAIGCGTWRPVDFLFYATMESIGEAWEYIGGGEWSNYSVHEQPDRTDVVVVTRAEQMDEYIAFNGDWGEWCYLHTTKEAEIEWYPPSPPESDNLSGVAAENFGGDCEGEAT